MCLFTFTVEYCLSGLYLDIHYMCLLKNKYWHRAHWYLDLRHNYGLKHNLEAMHELRMWGGVCTKQRCVSVMCDFDLVLKYIFFCNITSIEEQSSTTLITAYQGAFLINANTFYWIYSTKLWNALWDQYQIHKLHY